MSFQNNHDRWNTEEEKAFLRKLGKGCHTLKRCINIQSTRAVLLQKYIKAAETRTGWGYVDRDEIIAYAKEQLAKEEVCQSKS